MSFREHSSKENWSDWELAHLAVDIRSMTRYGGILAAEVEPRLRNEFTTEEIQRADAYLAVSLPDTGRLTTIKDRLDTADSDTRWLIEQLTIAWERLDTLRDRLDDAGSLMHNSHVASAIGYIRRTRPTDT
ncbi:hypothetical protein [Streptomyces sp. NPDC086010]|uniref:hypothetical protein n=1 Tax=Streptomyces sp. NPDC086010 TaxID=3365745 RepID=UPI0037D8D08D